MTNRAAVAEIARDLGEEGSGVAHTGGDLATGDAQDADLLREFDAEADLLGDASIPAPKRQPGRPKGSARNTRQLAQYMRARGYRDPLEYLAALYTADPVQLAKDLEIDPVDVLKIQRQAASDSLPYWHRKQPLDVHHTGDTTRALVVIQDGPLGGMAADADARMSIHDPLELQAVTDGDSENSHASHSHDHAQPADNPEQSPSKPADHVSASQPKDGP